MEQLPSKSEIAYRKIKEMIHKGILTRDQPISENRLASELKMSRTPIRSALKLLEKEGFVKIVPKLGIYLQELSDEEANQLYDVRRALERFVIEQIIDVITAEDIKKLREMIDFQRKAFEQNDPVAFMASDQQFHSYFFKIYNNPKMSELLEQLQDRFFLIGLRACKYGKRMEPSIQEHTLLISALEERDLKAALEYITNNIRWQSS